MIPRKALLESARTAMVLLVAVGAPPNVLAQQGTKPKAEGSTSAVAAPPVEQPGGITESARSSTEQGQTPLTEAFEQETRQWRLEKRRDALRDTEFKFNLRAFYLNREKFDGMRSQAFAIGGWAGMKTGYFFDHLSLGVTGYTSQRLYGEDDEDGTLLLASGQEGYSVLGELYADIRIIKDLNLYVGRKEFDTPFINRNDTRMTPNTFEAIVLQGKTKLGEGGAVLKYGIGYFDKIKERNSDEFVSMARDAGADASRGVFTAGALYENGKFSVGAIDYYCADVINIGYAEAKLELPINGAIKPRLALQFVDQRSVGNNLLQAEEFSAQQFGIKGELPVKSALLTVGYTQTTDGANMQAPWSGYPGYTSVQVQDFNRSGEGAFLLRAGYDFTSIKGLSAYALAVFGTDPGTPGQFQQNEYDFNVQWAPPEGVLKGLSLRVRYAIAQDDGALEDLKDFRVICNYAFKF
jgi:hypothetical protein